MNTNFQSKSIFTSKKFIAIVIAAIVVIAALFFLFFSGGEQGSHSVTPAEGGTWDYGSSAGRTWSNFHNEKPHSAWVRGHAFVDSGCTAGGDWARATTGSHWVSAFKDTQGIELCNG